MIVAAAGVTLTLLTIPAVLPGIVAVAYEEKGGGVQPGISERTYEFCYNAEFVCKHSTVLASFPYLPSLNAEKELGYDVEFRLRKGTYTRSLFIQHKVSHCAKNRSGRNVAFYNAHGGPYYRFPISTDQHDVLHKLALKRGNTFYCAPLFHTRGEILESFRRNSVTDDSSLFSVRRFGTVTGKGHHFTYEPDGKFGYLHSQPVKVPGVRGLQRGIADLQQEHINDQYLADLSVDISEVTADLRQLSPPPPDFHDAPALQKTQYMLARYCRVSWVIVP